MTAKPKKVQQAAVDLDEAQRFLDLIGPRAKWWTFQTFDDDKDEKDRLLGRTRHGTLTKLAPELKEVNERGAGVFVCPNRTDGKGRCKENIIGIRAVSVDLDGAPLDPVKKCELPPHVIIETSPGRYHAHWRVKDLPVDEFEDIQRGIAKRFDGDTGIAKLTHCARLAGFDHKKRGRFRVRIVEGHKRLPYTVDEIVKAFPPEKKPHKAPSSRSGATLPKGAYVQAAQEFIKHVYARDDVPGLVAHRGDFFKWTGTHYEPVGRKNLTSEVYGFLNDCWVQHHGNIEPYNPSRSKVAEVLAALDAGVNEDETLDAPFWIQIYPLRCQHASASRARTACSISSPRS